MRLRLVWAAGLLAVLAPLWIFPGALFQHPGPNEAIILADLQLPVYLVALVGLMVAVVATHGLRSAVVRVGLGMFLLGAAADFVLGLVTFGNLSNDRFLPLLILPLPTGVAGIVALAAGPVGSRWARRDIFLGASIGLIATAVVGTWTLLRGARDWLLAPYGSDIGVLVVVIGTVLVLLSSPPGEPHARSDTTNL